MIRPSSLRAPAAAVLLLGAAACADAPGLTGPDPSAGPAAPADEVSATAASLADAFLTVSAGAGFTCGGTLTGDLYCWGVNDSGELGQGDLVSRAAPTRVSGVSAVLAVSAGADHACALMVAGGVSCWGANDFGQLGNGTTTASATPVAVTAPAGVRFVSVSSGAFHTCALAAGGDAYCWGDNFFGQLGTGGAELSATPQRVAAPAGLRFAAVATGDGATHTCAVDAGRTAIYCWGDDTYGQLGDGAAGGVSATPVAVAAPAGVRLAGVSGVGFGHSCAVAADRTAWCWGDNARGQLGNGTTVSTAVPVAAATTARFVEATAGWFHTCGATLLAGVQCWGDNASGKLGLGTSGGFQTSPATVPGSDATFGRTDAGAEHSCSRGRDGRSWCWGRGGFGELGNGAIGNASAPVRVTPPSQAATLAPSLQRAGSADGAVPSGLRRWCEARADRDRIAACA